MSDSRRIVRLFTRLAAIYGPLWSAHYAGDMGRLAVAEWTDALADLADAHLAAGIAACRESPDHYPPSLGEFRGRCLGLGSDGEAVEAAMRGDRSHPIARRLIESVPSWDRNQVYSARELRRVYRDGLDAARRQAVAEAVANPPALPAAAPLRLMSGGEH